MKKIILTDVSDEDLIARFVEAAKRMGAAVLDSEMRDANRMYLFMRAIDGELRLRGRSVRLKLAPLLNDSDRFVRYYAAQKLLGLVPGPARAILEWNHQYGFDAISGDAGMLLAALDNGEYKPD